MTKPLAVLVLTYPEQIHGSCPESCSEWGGGMSVAS